jgi:hypothetical protein
MTGEEPPMSPRAKRTPSERSPPERPAEASPTQGEEGGRGRPRGRAAEEEGLLAAVEAGLEEALPGLSVLDRELELEGGGHAELAGVDDLGRLVLVIVAQDDAGQAVLDALDTLAWAQRHADVLARHLGSPLARPELEPRVIVIAPAPDERLVVRLATLGASGIRAFGVQTVRSAGSERAYLVPLALAGAGPRRASPETLFLEGLAPELRAAARALLERMERLDDELVPAYDHGAILWRFRGEVLARVEPEGDQLAARVPPLHEALPLGDEMAVERFLELALGRLVELLGTTRPRATATGATGATGGGGVARAREGPGEAGEVLLTPEEIEAFRE